jgi:predicted secreted protein
MISTRLPTFFPRWRLAALSAVLSLAAAVSVLSTPVLAQTPPPPVNVVSLSASGLVEAPQDWLTIRLGTVREGPDAATVQAQLKTALDAALATARAAAQPGQVEVRTGAFGLYPRHGRDGRIQGWQGTAELILEGRDTARLGTLAGRLSTLAVQQTAFSLSREARRRLESEVQAQAIERFKARAGEVAQAFGFGGYTLREVTISSADEAPRPVMARALALEAKAAMADAPLPLEAGTASVSVTVSGAVQLR